ncbi:MAG: DUF1302 domain-containing protein [Panacagrimonas sp.]
MLLLLGFITASASGYEIEMRGGDFDGWRLQLRNRLSVGSAWRMQERRDSFIGKATLTPGLCAPDDCLSLVPGNTAPNERYLAARGSLSSNTDDGNLNYDKGDAIGAGLRLNSRLRFGTDDYGLELSARFYYDTINTDFSETHPNRIVEPGSQPGEYVRSPRPSESERALGSALELMDANVYYYFDAWEDHPLEIRLGRQVLTWGKSAINVQGTLNFINPTDANALGRAGLELQDTYFPQNMLVLGAPISPEWSFEAFYQLEWRPYGFPARGSYFSYFDAGVDVTPQETLVGLYSKAPEDPDQVGVPASGVNRLITSTSYSLARARNREPGSTGQYGISFNWQLDDYFDSPLSLSLFYANYHSRLPSISAYAADASCTRREGNARGQDTLNAAEFQVDCGVGSPGTGRADALPLDTVRYFLDYAEDIKLWGVAFDTEAFDLAVQGELVYRENEPIQVDLEDVLFAAYQPAFPRNDIAVLPGVAALPSSQRAAPDYLTRYRVGRPGEVAPNSYIRGYERMETLHGTLGFTKITGARSILGANEAVYLLEMSANYIPGLPSLNEIQFDGPGTNTNFSPGTAETGDALKLNPVRNNSNGYVTRLAYGYRLAGLLRYNDSFVPGLSISPLLIFAHDLNGVAPGPTENFLSGRRIITSSLQGQYRSWRINLLYTWFSGGGDAHLLRDRDAMGVSVNYEF